MLQNLANGITHNCEMCQLTQLGVVVLMLANLISVQAVEKLAKSKHMKLHVLSNLRPL